MQSYECFFKVSFSWVAKNKPRRNRIVKDNQKLFITFYRFYKYKPSVFFNIKKPPFFRRFSKVLNLYPLLGIGKQVFYFRSFFRAQIAVGNEIAKHRFYVCDGNFKLRSNHCQIALINRDVGI